MIPEPQRVALHHAGHAVVQTLVGRNSFAVTRVSIDGPCHQAQPNPPALGEALIDREVFLGLYQFGLVTLAGIAAENRYLVTTPPEEEPLVALSDLDAWQEQARGVLGGEARVKLVSINVMAKLDEWMGDEGIWRVVERLAAALHEQGTVEGEQLRQILSPLAGGEQAGQ